VDKSKSRSGSGGETLRKSFYAKSMKPSLDSRLGVDPRQATSRFAERRLPHARQKVRVASSPRAKRPFSAGTGRNRRAETAQKVLGEFPISTPCGHADMCAKSENSARCSPARPDEAHPENAHAMDEVKAINELKAGAGKIRWTRPPTAT
jgi:hypothetical protein